MKFQLFPSVTRGIDLLRELATLIRHSVNPVAEMIGNPQDGEQQLHLLAEAETSATDTHYALLTHLRTSYVSPLPREDMYTFSRLLHATMEHLRGTGELIREVGSTPLSERAAEQLGLLSQLADLAADSLQRLNKLDDLEDNWLQMVQLSKRATRTHLVWSQEVGKFSKASTMHRHQNVADQLLRAIGSLREFADHLGRVLVKES
ncbi:hypothetical protein [Glutamicibacter endophyticus]|uniref:hypothetical protein n=1 Tax=Glutamicibacter endophyticus TaxID=1522174 RepID=UPI003AF1B77F